MDRAAHWPGHRQPRWKAPRRHGPKARRVSRNLVRVRMKLVSLMGCLVESSLLTMIFHRIFRLVFTPQSLVDVGQAQANGRESPQQPHVRNGESLLHRIEKYSNFLQVAGLINHLIVISALVSCVSCVASL
jgi:hypothetical protein